ncbi:MAG: HAD-IIB family hydrolase, partial [Cyanobacteria bacterium]|nr:HAD-IIB family hydrolase [Cyanobacteriota bacterium]
MQYLAAAFDYDGTLAHHGTVSSAVVDALRKLKTSGRKLIMVTGRHLENLLDVFPEANIFDSLVVENGALLYNPTTKEEKPLSERFNKDLVDGLRKIPVDPLEVGRCIVATCEPYHTHALSVIKELGLELQVIFNKGAVMILPSGTNKGSGLLKALEELGLSAHNVAGAGDAENDHAFLALCEMSVAVQNALPSIKERVDFITQKHHGDGIIEMIDELLRDEFESLRVVRHNLDLGFDIEDKRVTFNPHKTNLLIAGPSGGGKSNATLGFLNTLTEAGYQFIVTDPEGDYEAYDNIVVLGSTDRAPSMEEIFQVLQSPESNLIVNLLGIPLADRPIFFSELMPKLQHMRTEFGRPHWIVIDEAHHLLPKDWTPAEQLVPQSIQNLALITVHPDMVSPLILQDIDILVAVSDHPDQTLKDFAKITNHPVPKLDKNIQLEKGQAVVWEPGTDQEPNIVSLVMSNREKTRHRRKYAEGSLGEQRSFYFTGPHKLRLRAQNLSIFTQIAEGVDEDTWLYHLRRKEYSDWFEKIIKDDELVTIAKEVEEDEELTAKESRVRILQAIEERYTAPAKSST